MARGMIEQLYTVDAAASLLSVSRRQVYRWITSRELHPIYEVGAGKRIPASAISRFLNPRRVGLVQQEAS